MFLWLNEIQLFNSIKILCKWKINRRYLFFHCFSNSNSKHNNKHSNSNSSNRNNSISNNSRRPIRQEVEMWGKAAHRREIRHPLALWQRPTSRRPNRNRSSAICAIENSKIYRHSMATWDSMAVTSKR